MVSYFVLKPNSIHIHTFTDLVCNYFSLLMRTKLLNLILKTSWMLPSGWALYHLCYKIYSYLLSNVSLKQCCNAFAQSRCVRYIVIYMLCTSMWHILWCIWWLKPMCYTYACHYVLIIYCCIHIVLSSLSEDSIFVCFSTLWNLMTTTCCCVTLSLLFSTHKYIFSRV